MPCLRHFGRALCLVALPLAFCVFSASAQAADAKDRFASMDTNGDGKVEWSEFHIAFPNMREAAFAAIDRNGDKYIDRAEWDRFTLDHGKGMMPPQGAMTPGDDGGSRMPPMVTPPDAAK